MSKIQILSKTGRSGAYTIGNCQLLRDNKIYYKQLPDGTYRVIAKWGIEQTRYPDEITEIVITSMTPAAKAIIKDSLGLNHVWGCLKVRWVEMQ